MGGGVRYSRWETWRRMNECHTAAVKSQDDTGPQEKPWHTLMCLKCIKAAQIIKSLTRLNWLRLFCQQCNETFLKCWLLTFWQTVEASLQNITELRDEQPRRFELYDRAVERESPDVIFPAVHSHLWRLHLVFLHFHFLMKNVEVLVCLLCVAALFFPTVITVLEIYESPVLSITFWPSVAVIGSYWTVCRKMKV